MDRDKGEAAHNFAAFCKVFKENYALFDVKGIDWDKECAYYAKKINDSITDDELFSVFQEILKKLDDKHCYIYRFNEIYFSGFGLPSLNYIDLLSFDFRLPTHNFSLPLIEENYLIDYEKSLKVKSFLPPVGIRNVFTTGWLTDSIAYLHMTEMSNKSDEVHHSISSFLKNYEKAKGFVIDIRDNIGGYSSPVKELAEYFTRRRCTYAISRVRSFEATDSFQEPEYWQLEPNKKSKYNCEPIALLTNSNTQSAAELFTLMMKTIPEVKVIGDITSGIFADTHIGKLPNGWEYRLSIRKTNDWNDHVVEDIGLVPDLLLTNSKIDYQNHVDKILDCAIEYIQETNKSRGVDF
jgi:hypothetical protein